MPDREAGDDAGEAEDVLGFVRGLVSARADRGGAPMSAEAMPPLVLRPSQRIDRHDMAEAPAPLVLGPEMRVAAPDGGEAAALDWRDADILAPASGARVTTGPAGEVIVRIAPDEGALRALIADVLREELIAPLGERIAGDLRKDLRKMVRREIRRALADQGRD